MRRSACEGRRPGASHGDALRSHSAACGSAHAQYRGSGTVNGVGGYSFLLTAIDGARPGGGGVDRFRIKIWGAGGVVYDNQAGASDDADPSTALGGGSIVIHT